MNLKQDWSGWLLCVVCGALNAACFLALGGTFVGFMAGNLIGMGVSLGESGVHLASLVFLLPLLSYSVGALVIGVARHRPLSASQRKDGLWIAWLLFLVVTLSVWATDSPLVGVMRWFVVMATALCMGFLSSALYLSRQRQWSANAMKPTSTRFLMDMPLQLVAHHAAGSKVMAIAGLLIGAALGAWLTHSGGIKHVYTVSLLLLLVGIAGEVRQIDSKAA